MSTAADIVAAIDALILAKLQGATDVAQLCQRNLGSLGINVPSGLAELRALRAEYNREASSGDPISETFVIEA